MLDTIFKLSNTVMNTFKSVYQLFFNKTIFELVQGETVVSDVLEWLVNVLGASNLTLGSMILGAGITTFIIFTIVKWVVGIIK